MEAISHDKLTPYLQTTFTVQSADPPYPLTLVEITPQPTRPRQTVTTLDGHQVELRSDPFTLLLRGPADRFLPQRMYTLNHEALGELANWFLVPVGRDEEGFLYEVVFN